MKTITTNVYWAEIGGEKVFDKELMREEFEQKLQEL